jgi:hypothetical protein
MTAMLQIRTLAPERLSNVVWREIAIPAVLAGKGTKFAIQAIIRRTIREGSANGQVETDVRSGCHILPQH